MAVVSAQLKSGVTASVTLCNAAVLGSGHRVGFYGDAGAIVLGNPTANAIKGFRLFMGKRGDAELQEFGQDNKLLVRVKASTTIEEKTAERVMAIFTKEFPNNKFTVDSSTEIGPTIGKKLQEDALIAIVVVPTPPFGEKTVTTRASPACVRSWCRLCTSLIRLTRS